MTAARMSPQARRRLHRTMSLVEFNDLAGELADQLADPDTWRWTQLAEVIFDTLTEGYETQ